MMPSVHLPTGNFSSSFRTIRSNKEDKLVFLASRFLFGEISRFDSKSVQQSVLPFVCPLFWNLSFD